MRLILINTLLFSFVWSGCGSGNNMTKSEIAEYYDSTIKIFKKTKTVFLYRPEDVLRLEQYKIALSDAWTITPLIFAPESETNKYAAKPGYSFFQVNGSSKEAMVSGGKSMGFHSHYFMALITPNGRRDEKGDIVLDVIYRNELFTRMGNSNDLFPKEQSYFNFNPVQLAVYFRIANNNLLSGSRGPGVWDEIKDASLQPALAKDTLYIPENILIDFNKFNGKETKNTENLFGSYPYKYKICSQDELFQIFFIRKTGRLLFDYVKSSTDKHVSILDYKQGKILYKAYTAVSYNLKEKDIKNILQ
jgi:hypothetical protein